jgi:hypothetical protein
MCAVLNMAVFCSSLTSWFPGMLLTYFLNDYEIVPVAQIITGITLVFTYYHHHHRHYHNHGYLRIDSDFVIGQYFVRISRESSRIELNKPKTYGHIVLSQHSLQAKDEGDD